MLVRTIGQGGTLVLGGGHPGVVSLLKIGGSRVKVGLHVHQEVPILNVKLLCRLIASELKNDLLPEEKLALRAMLVLLEDPRSNSAAIVELLCEPTLVELTYVAPRE